MWVVTEVHKWKTKMKKQKRSFYGRKRSLILANFLNCIYMLVIMFSTNLFNLITAEILSSLAFGIKETVDPALLNESIFINPQNENKKHKIQEFNQLKDLKYSFKFILKSERLKALILFSAISGGVISLMATYEVSLLEDFNMPAKYLCMIFAILGIISGIVAKRQESFHERYKNKSLSALLVSLGHFY